MCADCRAPEQHDGPHPALVARKPVESERQAPTDWRHPGPRIIGAEYPERAECEF